MFSQHCLFETSKAVAFKDTLQLFSVEFFTTVNMVLICYKLR